LDPRLLVATEESARLDDIQANESLVRRGAHAYSQALKTIRLELNQPRPNRETIIEIARTALSKSLDDEVEMRGKHISVRMCSYILRDRFIALARILDCAADGEDILAQAHAQVQRAYAGISLH
jgi:hypothetical protein